MNSLLLRGARRAARALIGVLLREVWQDGGAEQPEGVLYLTVGRMAGHGRRWRRVTQTLGYPPPSSRRPAVGWGMYVRRGEVSGGGEGMGSGGSRRNRRFETSYGMGSGSALFGYTIHQSSSLRVFPLIGAGGAGEGLSVKPRDDAKAKALAAAGTGGPVLKLGWATEFRIKLLPNAGVLVGIHTGWLVRVLPIPWAGRGWEGARLPRARFVRPYFNFVVGGFMSRG